MSRIAEKYYAPIIEKYYPKATFITMSACDRYIKTRNQVVIMWHYNTPLDKAIENWRKVNKIYPDAIYLMNNQDILGLAKKESHRCHFLPLSIDTGVLPKPKKDKELEELWFGNVWDHHKETFANYKGDWISKGLHNGVPISRAKALDVVNNTKKVRAIGLCAVEAKYLGCEVFGYNDKDYEVLLPQDVAIILEEIIKTEKSIKPENRQRSH